MQDNIIFKNAIIEKVSLFQVSFYTTKITSTNSQQIVKRFYSIQNKAVAVFDEIWVEHVTQAIENMIERRNLSIDAATDAFLKDP